MGLDSAVNWVGDNPLTAGGAVAGTAFGGPIGGIAGGVGGSFLDSASDTNSEHDEFMAGSGLSNPAAFQPYDTFGLQPGDPTGYEGITDFTQPGMGEAAAGRVSEWDPRYATSAWDTTNRWFRSKPRSAAEAESALANAPGQANTTNYAEEQYQGFSGPDLQDANLDKYYDNAKRRAAESINQNAAARGSFASSVAQDMANEAFVNLEAEKANREADYGLRRSAEERAWEGLGGQLASSADASGRANAATEMDWLTGRSNIAATADEVERARTMDFIKTSFAMDDAAAEQLMRELEAGVIGQRLGENRSNQLFGNTMGFAGAADDIAGPMYNDMVRTDQDLMNQILEYSTGIAALGRDESNRNTDQMYRDLQTIYSIGRDQGWF